MAPRLILIGFMATGKSATGRALAARLGWQLVDIDRLIANRAGKPIAAIFAEVGEARFRDLEHEVISELAKRDLRCPQCGQPRPMIISPGGGALIDRRNHAALSAMGLIICLTARVDVIAARVGRAREARPKLLEGGLPLERRIAQLMEERRELYARADFTIDTSERTVEEVVDSILAAIVDRWRKKIKTADWRVADGNEMNRF
jgi:shikimate kinase